MNYSELINPNILACFVEILLNWANQKLRIVILNQSISNSKYRMTCYIYDKNAIRHIYSMPRKNKTNAYDCDYSHLTMHVFQIEIQINHFYYLEKIRQKENVKRKEEKKAKTTSFTTIQCVIAVVMFTLFVWHHKQYSILEWFSRSFVASNGILFRKM